MDEINLSASPWCRIHSWMNELGLGKAELTAFALLWERSHPLGDEAGRIDGAYLQDMLGADAYPTLNKLVGKGFVRFDLSAAGDILSAFAPCDDAVYGKIDAIREENLQDATRNV